MNKLILLVVILSLIGCKRNQLFLEDNSQWVVENGFYKNTDINTKGKKVVFLNTVMFYNHKIYLDVGAGSSPGVNYRIKRRISSSLYEIRIWSFSDGINELIFLLIDDLKDDTDSNGCSEILIHSPSLELYLWKQTGLVFLPDKFGTNDLDLGMLPDKV